MSIDTIAVLRIRELAVPGAAGRVPVYIEHCGDCSLIHTHQGFYQAAADEHALAVRHLLGDALDAHDDPRGILFLPDVCEPRGSSYDVIVSEYEGAGVWSPIVVRDHVVARFTAAIPGTHEALVAEMVETMGRDVATSTDMMAQALSIVMRSPGREDATADYRTKIDAVKAAMGEDFGARYDLSLESRVEIILAGSAVENKRLEMKQLQLSSDQTAELLEHAGALATAIQARFDRDGVTEEALRKRFGVSSEPESSDGKKGSSDR